MQIFLEYLAFCWLEILWQQAVPSQIFNSETINAYYDLAIDEDDGPLDLNEQPHKPQVIDDGNVMGISNCSVCFNGFKNRDRVLIPCGRCLCAYCANGIGRKCPICRMEIKVKNAIHYHV
jgi:hypothetical protein